MSALNVTLTCRGSCLAGDIGDNKPDYHYDHDPVVACVPKFSRYIFHSAVEFEVGCLNTWAKINVYNHIDQIITYSEL